MSNIRLDEAIFSIRRLLMSILWPSFIMASVSMGVLFSLIEPESLTMHGEGVELSNIVVYSIAFFIFWFLGALSSALTALLMCKFK
jgi:hypothetical protein